MRRALELAESAIGRTGPNPMVGAVIIDQNGEIVGEGFHKKAGTPHAEIHAIENAGDLARSATMFVTLEPCCHFGRTPPCADAIIRSGIKKVIVAMIDPNPEVSGKGIEILKRSGIEVEIGLCEDRSKKLNEIFVKFIRTKLPFVILKSAMSLDGKIATATGESKWITSEAARLRVHEMRDRVDAILVGVGTVLKDDPSLTTRLPDRLGVDAIRIVVDSAGRTPINAKIFNRESSAKTIIASTDQISASRISAFESRSAEVLIVDSVEDRVDLKSLMIELGKRNITSVMIEGGSEMGDSAIRSGIVDKVIFFIAPKLIGGRDAPTPIGGDGFAKLASAIEVKNWQISQIGSDLVIEGDLTKN